MANKLKKFKVEKLIRDNIPEIRQKVGIQFKIRELSQNEYHKALKDKIVEEAEEVKNAQNQKEIIEELADCLEVIISIAKAHGIDYQTVEEYRMKKKDEKGGFDNKIYCEYSTIDDNSPVINEFLNNPKYPEILDE